MDTDRRYNDYILGDAKLLATIPKEELALVKKKPNDTLYIWRDCFVKTLLIHKMTVDDFIKLYLEFKKGNKQPIYKLGILPEKLVKNKRLALIYIEALVYVTFKRDLTMMYKTKTLLQLGYPS